LGLIGSGDWRETVWEIFYDASYRIYIKYNPVFEPETEQIPQFRTQILNGELNKEAFTKLLQLLSTGQWRTPGKEIVACDGTAWKIDFYSENGELLNSSGKLGYIYGEKVLEEIVRLLPQCP